MIGENILSISESLIIIYPHSKKKPEYINLENLFIKDGYIYIYIWSR